MDYVFVENKTKNELWVDSRSVKSIECFDSHEWYGLRTAFSKNPTWTIEDEVFIIFIDK